MLFYLIDVCANRIAICIVFVSIIGVVVACSHNDKYSWQLYTTSAISVVELYVYGLWSYLKKRSKTVKFNTLWWKYIYIFIYFTSAVRRDSWEWNCHSDCLIACSFQPRLETHLDGLTRKKALLWKKQAVICLMALWINRAKVDIEMFSQWWLLTKLSLSITHPMKPWIWTFSYISNPDPIIWCPLVSYQRHLHFSSSCIPMNLMLRRVCNS